MHVKKFWPSEFHEFHFISQIALFYPQPIFLPNVMKVRWDCLYTSLTGDKLLHWSIIFALAGANWSTTPVYYFRFVLCNGCDFCEEKCPRNKREVAPGNWDCTSFTRRYLAELTGTDGWGIAKTSSVESPLQVLEFYFLREIGEHIIITYLQGKCNPI